MKRIRNNDQEPQNKNETACSSYELALVPRDHIHIPLTHHQIMANLRLISELSSVNKSSEPTPIFRLNDVIPNILSFCDGSTLARAACVCTEWRDLCNRNELWENLCRQTFGVSAQQLTPSPDPVKELYVLSHLHLRATWSSALQSSMPIRAVPNVIPLGNMMMMMRPLL
ncbi:unnamed protein product [Cylindrotheca closterium]|uniref:F-box domain-containing protein n=1 Tax=Cylindrotheca closterium TaxID=2856 RepID=A0AAD2CH21_9STRA|nr:unnamed protein product [Cylindrotheca closterium]